MAARAAKGLDPARGSQTAVPAAALRIESPFVADRVQAFPESVIRAMSRVAAAHGAVNLGQGFPDFDPPREVMDAAKKAIDDGFNQYAVTWGAPALREAICRKLADFNRIEAKPDDNVVVTCGATEAMMATLLAVCNPGDRVVIFEPFYENFGPDAVVAGATPLFVPLRAPDHQPDAEALKAAMARRPKAVIVNTPGNPTGRIFTEATLRLVADLCVQHDVLAITDEIYEHMVYDGKRHLSIATLPGMAERTVTIGGFSKTYSVTGWRLAYTAAPKPVTDAVKRVHDFLTVGAAHPLQIAAVAALGLPASYYTQLRDSYQGKRDLLLGALETAGFRCHRPDSAYYILADWTALAGPQAFADDTDFSLWLTKEVGVTSIPGSSFFHDKSLGRHLVRFAYPKKEATLQEAARRLASAKAKAAGRQAR
jgi:aminotransferase